MLKDNNNSVMIPLYALLLGWCLFAPITVLAAKPTAITYESDGVTADGVVYANYLVRCSDSRKPLITAWDKRKKWCQGKNSQENCHKRQIKAAIAACK